MQAWLKGALWEFFKKWPNFCYSISIERGDQTGFTQNSIWGSPGGLQNVIRRWNILCKMKYELFQWRWARVKPHNYFLTALIQRASIARNILISLGITIFVENTRLAGMNFLWWHTLLVRRANSLYLLEVNYPLITFRFFVIISKAILAGMFPLDSLGAPFNRTCIIWKLSFCFLWNFSGGHSVNDLLEAV